MSPAPKPDEGLAGLELQIGLVADEPVSRYTSSAL